MAVRPCCQCNSSNAKCLRCSCVRSKTPCSSCHPSRSGRCERHEYPCSFQQDFILNRNSLSHVPSPQSWSSSPSPNQQPGDGPLPPSSFSFPFLLSISRVCVFTLQHIPKGTHDTWSGLVTTELNSILSSPSDMNSLCKFMMLAKCILINPSGRHFSWWDTLRIVKDRAKRWFEGDFTGLWAEVIAEESKASHKLTSNSLRSNNARQDSQAVHKIATSVKAFKLFPPMVWLRLPLKQEINSRHLSRAIDQSTFDSLLLNNPQ